mgnify:FL=1
MHPMTERALLTHLLQMGLSESVLPSVRRLFLAIQKGHTALPLSAEDAALWEASAWHQTSPSELPFVRTGPWLQTARHAAQESRVAHALKQRVSESVQSLPVLQSLMPHADASQQAAIQKAIPQSLALILGGPGSGKTTTAAAIVAGKLQQKDWATTPRVALLAPTGKAAARLTDAFQKALTTMAPECRPALGLKATTVHRQLDALSDKDLVLIDEASMVSLDLMDRLLQTLNPNADLVMMGDPYQLASVEAGSILATLAGAHCFDSARSYLTGRHRTGEAAKLNTLLDLCLAGEVSAFFEAVHELDIPWLRPPAETELESLILKGYQSYFDALKAGNLPDHTEFQCLTSISSGSGGRHWVNKLVSQFAHQLGLKGQGHRLILTENQPALEVFNGDLAIALDPETTANPRLKIIGSDRIVSRHQISRPETAYAISIHRAQGSEYPDVLVCLPTPTDQSAYQPTRELLYTALTRAKRNVSLWGTEQEFTRALTTPTIRHSALGYFLDGQ